MHHLIETNTTWLQQALDVMQHAGEAAFTTSPPRFAPQRASAHLRHILEFYECFLDGAATLHIDYDARRRDSLVENSAAAAVSRIRQIIARLESLDALGDSLVWVRPEDSEGSAWLTSSIARELQVLSSHTIHHFALIAMTLRAHGIEVDEDFGVSPSTLRYQRSRQAA